MYHIYKNEYAVVKYFLLFVILYLEQLLDCINHEIKTYFLLGLTKNIDKKVYQYTISCDAISRYKIKSWLGC